MNAYPSRAAESNLVNANRIRAIGGTLPTQMERYKTAFRGCELI